MAAADTENVRRLFVDRFGRPDRTYLHGQSWGGNVAAKLAETDGAASEYANSIAALDAWVRSGRKPTPRSIARSCGAFDSTYGSGCFYDPEFRPAPYATQVRPRPGGLRWPAMTAAQERAWSRIDGVGIAP